MHEIKDDQQKMEQVKSHEEVQPVLEKKNILQTIRGNPKLLGGSILVLVIAIVGIIFYWKDASSKIYIEKSEIWAPIISLAPKNGGEIGAIRINEGDIVADGQNLAIVGGQIIAAKTSGIITWVDNSPGQMASSQSPVIKMVDPRELRVVGHIKEGKGLSDIRVGQRVIFTVDAFGSKQFAGVVEKIGATSRESSVVFSISDKREEKEFDVTATYDVAAYPELKNGMSAKMWVIK